jgi:mono/diheme cytochrome c family protein
MRTLLIAAIGAAALSAASPEVDIYLQQLQSEAALPFGVKRGEALFTTEHIGKKGTKIACTSCHGIDLAQNGRNANTGKVIEPLAPRANPARLTSVKEVKKWLRRNFRDVYDREGTAQEKGDVLTYIMNDN